jgi:hypothetical protein
MAANGGTVAPVSVKTSMSYDDSKVDDFERKSMGSDEGSDDYKVLVAGAEMNGPRTTDAAPAPLHSTCAPAACSQRPSHARASAV